MDGARGNVADRLRQGYVVDFIQRFYIDYHRSNFNIAGSAICIGTARLILDVFGLRVLKARPDI